LKAIRFIKVLNRMGNMAQNPLLKIRIETEEYIYEEYTEA